MRCSYAILRAVSVQFVQFMRFGEHPYLWEGFLVLGKLLKRRPIHFGWCNGLIAGSGKLEKKKVRRNLVGARSLEGLGTLDRLGLEGLVLCCVCQLYSLVDYWLLGGRRRGLTPRTSVSSSITHCYVVFVFASLFP